MKNNELEKFLDLNTDHYFKKTKHIILKNKGLGLAWFWLWLGFGFGLALALVLVRPWAHGPSSRDARRNR